MSVVKVHNGSVWKWVKWVGARVWGECQWLRIGPMVRVVVQQSGVCRRFLITRLRGVSVGNYVVMPKMLCQLLYGPGVPTAYEWQCMRWEVLEWAPNKKLPTYDYWKNPERNRHYGTVPITLYSVINPYPLKSCGVCRSSTGNSIAFSVGSNGFL